MDDFTSLVPCYTFPTDSLEVQESALATNPLMQRLIDSRKSYEGDPPSSRLPLRESRSHAQRSQRTVLLAGAAGTSSTRRIRPRTRGSTGDTPYRTISSTGGTCPTASIRTRSAAATRAPRLVGGRPRDRHVPRDGGGQHGRGFERSPAPQLGEGHRRSRHPHAAEGRTARAVQRLRPDASGRRTGCTIRSPRAPSRRGRRASRYARTTFSVPWTWSTGPTCIPLSKTTPTLSLETTAQFPLFLAHWRPPHPALFQPHERSPVPAWGLRQGSGQVRRGPTAPSSISARTPLAVSTPLRQRRTAGAVSSRSST